MAYELAVTLLDDLEVKQVGAPPTADTSGTPTQIARLRRTGVEMDPGRRWAGELYEEGEVSDPADAFAHYRLEGADDTEAWLDKNDDATLEGWVREGDELWHYPDASTWALDVDGAQMTRISSQVEPAEMEVDLPDTPDGELAAAPAPLTADEPPAGEVDPSDDDEAFGDDYQFENPFADLVDGEPAGDPVDPDDDETPGGETNKDRLFRKKMQGKAAPFPQHGALAGVQTGPRRIDAKAHFAGECGGGRGGREPSTDKEPSPSAERPSAPTLATRLTAGMGPRPGKGPTSLVSLTDTQLDDMSSDELIALTTHHGHYDPATVGRASVRLGRLRDEGDTGGWDAIDDPGAGDVIPQAWRVWAATAGRPPTKQPTRDAAIREAWRDYLDAMSLMAETETRGTLLNRKTSNRGLPVGVTIRMLLTNDALRERYGSEELRRWVSAHPIPTLAEFRAGKGSSFTSDSEFG